MIKRLQKLSSKKQLYFAVIIALSVIAFWRGVWGLMDLYIFPQNYLLSLIIPMVLGLMILVYTHYATKELM